MFLRAEMVPQFFKGAMHEKMSLDEEGGKHTNSQEHKTQIMYGLQKQKSTKAVESGSFFKMKMGCGHS